MRTSPHHGDFLLLLHGDRQTRSRDDADGGSLLTLTYGGANRVSPNYNVMGVAKAALESSVRYLAADFGRENIRVNAISAGPVRTLAARASRMRASPMPGRRSTRRLVADHARGTRRVGALPPLRFRRVTGEIHYVDSGYSIMKMPRASEVKAARRREPRETLLTLSGLCFWRC